MMNYFAWERDPTSIKNPGYWGSLSQSSGKRERNYLLANLSIPLSPIFGSQFQGILLSWERQYWFVFSHLLSSLLSLGLLPLKWDPGGDEGGILNPRPESEMLICWVTSSTSTIHWDSSVSLGYLSWKDYNCYEKLSYACKFKG